MTTRRPARDDIAWRAVPPVDVVREMLACVLVRVSWYETRGYAVPVDTLHALAWCCARLGLNPQDV